MEVKVVTSTDGLSCAFSRYLYKLENNEYGVFETDEEPPKGSVAPGGPEYLRLPYLLNKHTVIMKYWEFEDKYGTTRKIPDPLNNLEGVIPCSTSRVSVWEGMPSPYLSDLAMVEEDGLIVLVTDWSDYVKECVSKGESIMHVGWFAKVYRRCVM